jgi:hypothetical protein
MKGSGSFLKKRTKKLLFIEGCGNAGVKAPRAKFFWFFLFTKRTTCFVSEQRLAEGTIT